MSKTNIESDDSIIKIAACSYEGSLFGWKVTASKVAEDDQIATKSQKSKAKVNTEHLESHIQMNIGFHVSISSFKSVAVSASGKYLAVGGMDERIHVYNMITNKSLGEIAGHTGGINSLRFVEDHYLLSSSDDHTIYIWRVYDWQQVHILGGHKDSVLDFAIHPTGKIALSISKDQTMKLWNLVQGRCSFTRKLRHFAEQFLWHPSGESYVLVTSNEIQMFLIHDNSCQFEIQTQSRINHSIFVQISPDEYRLVYICDNQTLNIIDMNGKLLTNYLFTSLGAGRLKKLASCSSIGMPILSVDDAMSKKESQSDCLVMITSTGCVAVLNAVLMELNGPQPIETPTTATTITSRPKISSEESEVAFGKALYAFDQIRAEPRLTHVICWNSQVTTSFQTKHNTNNTQSNEEKHIMEFDPIVQDSDDEESSSSEDEEEEEKPEYKSKKANKPVKSDSHQPTNKQGNKSKQHKNSQSSHKEEVKKASKKVKFQAPSGNTKKKNNKK